MPGPVRQSSLVFQVGTQTSTVDPATINGVAAGNALVAVVVAVRPSGTPGDLITGYGTTIGGSAANTWGASPILRVSEKHPTEPHYTEITAWIAHNVSAGDTIGRPVFAFNDASTTVYTHMEEWSDVASSSSVDKTATAVAAVTDTSITVGPTAALDQAEQIVIAVAANRFNFVWNGGFSGAGNAPSTYAILQGRTDNTSGLVAQSVYKEVSATAAVSAVWTFDPQGNRTVAGIFTLRKSTTTLRLEIDDIDAEIVGTTGWTIGAWPQNAFQTGTPGQCAKVWVGYGATLSGTKLVLPDAPPGAALNASYNVCGYQPAGTRQLAWSTGVVREVA
jgi:hypothetical protein